MRAARYELPLALAIIGGDPARFRPYVDLYHRAFAQLGKPAPPIAVHPPGTSLIPTRRRARNTGKATK